MVFNPEPQTRQQSIFKQRRNDTLTHAYTHTHTHTDACVLYSISYERQ